MNSFKSYRIAIVLLFAFYLHPEALLAQEPAMKWGKVSSDEIKLTTCKFDSSATALVLFDNGQVIFSYGSDIKITRHVRIKILDSKGVSYADVKLPYYVKENLERISDVDAQTINVLPNGKTIIQQVDSKQIFDVDADKNWHEKRFNFPAVSPGSIIEYKFVTYSKNFTFLDGWTFQNSIPTLFTQFKALIPEGLDYRILLKGQRLLTKYDDKARNSWSLENTPALKDVPHVANYHDYAEMIQFQLAGYNKSKSDMSGGYEYVNLMTTWESLAKEMLESEWYTGYLNRHGVGKELLSSSLSSLKGNEGELEKAKAIYKFIRNRLSWDDTYRIYPDESISSVLEKRNASSAELNLVLVLVLREAGLKADPVLVSTRRNGKVFRIYPFLAQFNHLIANVQIGGKDYLLDATDPFRPFALLSPADLNEAGYLLNKNAPRWVDINPPLDTRQSILMEIDMTDLTKPLYQGSITSSGYEGSTMRNTYATDGEKAVKQALGLNLNEFDITKTKVENAEDDEKPFLVNYAFTTTDPAQANPAFIYLQPILYSHFKENPYKPEVRSLPVELEYPFLYTYVLNLTIPTGYETQELPKNIIVRLPDNYGEFKYLVNSNGERLQLVTTITMKSLTIPSQYYPELRSFYELIIAKYAEQIVLKKK